MKLLISPQAFHQKIPLFSQMTGSLFLGLDLSGFFLTEGIIEECRVELEKQLNNYVVSYKKDIFNLDTPIDAHLCALVKGAHLTKIQLKLLNNYERFVKQQNVTFVVYQKPLELISPYESPIAHLYSKYGKL